MALGCFLGMALGSYTIYGSLLAGHGPGLHVDWAWPWAYFFVTDIEMVVGQDPPGVYLDS